MIKKYKYFVVFMMVVLAISIYLIYYVKETENEMSISVSQISTTTPQVVSVLGDCQYKGLENWKRYYNSNLSIGICYSDNFKLSEGKDIVGFVPVELPLRNEKGWPNDIIRMDFYDLWPSELSALERHSNLGEYLKARGSFVEGFKDPYSIEEVKITNGLVGYKIIWNAEERIPSEGGWIETGKIYQSNPITYFRINKQIDKGTYGIIAIWLYSEDYLLSYDKMIKTFEFNL